MRVRIVWVSIAVSVSALAGHMVGGGGLSNSGECGVWRRVAAVGGFDMTVAARGLSRGDLRLGFSTRNTKSSGRTLGERSVLGLAIGTIVGVRKALIAAVEGRVFTTGGDGRLNRGLVREGLLDLRLGLSNLLSKWVVGLLGIGVAGEVGE